MVPLEFISAIEFFAMTYQTRLSLVLGVKKGESPLNKAFDIVIAYQHASLDADNIPAIDIYADKLNNRYGDSTGAVQLDLIWQEHEFLDYLFNTFVADDYLELWAYHILIKRIVILYGGSRYRQMLLLNENGASYLVDFVNDANRQVVAQAGVQLEPDGLTQYEMPQQGAYNQDQNFGSLFNEADMVDDDFNSPEFANLISIVSGLYSHNIDLALQCFIVLQQRGVSFHPISQHNQRGSVQYFADLSKAVQQQSMVEVDNAGSQALLMLCLKPLFSHEFLFEISAIKWSDQNLARIADLNTASAAYQLLVGLFRNILLPLQGQILSRRTRSHAQNSINSLMETIPLAVIYKDLIPIVAQMENRAPEIIARLVIQTIRNGEFVQAEVLIKSYVNGKPSFELQLVQTAVLQLKENLPSLSDFQVMYAEIGVLIVMALFMKHSHVHGSPSALESRYIGAQQLPQYELQLYSAQLFSEEMRNGVYTFEQIKRVVATMNYAEIITYFATLSYNDWPWVQIKMIRIFQELLISIILALETAPSKYERIPEIDVYADKLYVKYAKSRGAVMMGDVWQEHMSLKSQIEHSTSVDNLQYQAYRILIQRILFLYGGFQYHQMEEEEEEEVDVGDPYEYLTKFVLDTDMSNQRLPGPQPQRQQIIGPLPQMGSPSNSVDLELLNSDLLHGHSFDSDFDNIDFAQLLEIYKRVAHYGALFTYD
ncbi:hypothetical protein MIR68_001007 [Amoeboaphelidium protococcarum]|nr:hypothetical protein MIR68_001007 [Amoeboaphelidium protococcarum]